MLVMLLVLSVFCSVMTIQERKPVGRHAAAQVAKRIAGAFPREAGVLVVSADGAFVESLAERLRRDGFRPPPPISGTKRQMYEALRRAAKGRIEVIATTESDRLMVEQIQAETPVLARCEIVSAESYLWPTFLTWSNLLNVANKNVVIAVIAVGMTMVIITGGIDLSVGSLVAFSAVVAAKLIVLAGGRDAGTAAMIGCSLAAIAAAAGVGTFSGAMITRFKVPPFVVTLAMMWIASGLAYRISGGESIADLPASYNRLGMGADLLGIPNTLLLMLAIFAAGHLLMSRTVLGRHIYAVGGNREAARLSGIRVNRVLLFVYTMAGAMAGVGGVMLASQFTSGMPNYGKMYELQAIAAVVVGGTSLVGGEGKILGTLIGVLIIAVVQNVMNIWEIGPYEQQIVLGFILLGVVVLDSVKRQGWRLLLRPD